jgi:GT2 family glycosyltransferase
VSVTTVAYAAEPSAGTPAVSAVVVTHNGQELALRTLESMMSQAADLPVEWVVVDSGSSDGTPDAIEARWPFIEVTRLGNVGFAAARGRYLLALNPDTEVRWGSFGALVEKLDASPKVAAARVIQEEADGSLQCIRCSTLQEREREPLVYEEERAADWVVGAFIVLRREAVPAVGGFDERFFMYSEEADLCRRIREAGWEVRHLPVMRILPHGGKLNPRLVAQQTFSRLGYARKHFGGLAALSYRGVLALHHVVRLVAFTLAPGRRERRAFEGNALKVALGLAPPPFLPPLSPR